ncbi:hypothetical protein mRhiFer1_008977 [Rhinolophus ferrumequinum]|uniref:Uncharacterized protein n=1 Tax=Rhinolophus ferrumequinum TaxID=59479 RepID=A0A7J7TF02_RHIFE|nr:hypothetical protein mRhiFer1_008977 [Rhinolophus ferrumequinum]
MRNPNGHWVASASNEWNHDGIPGLNISPLGTGTSGPTKSQITGNEAQSSSSELLVVRVGGAPPTSSRWFLDPCILAVSKSRSGGASRSPASKENTSIPRTRDCPCEEAALSTLPSLVIANKGLLFCLSE